MAVSEKFSMQEIFKWGLFDITTGESLGYLRTLKESTLNQEATTVYATGGAGNTKLVGFSHSKMVTATLTEAILDLRAMSTIMGSDVVTGVNTNLMHYEELTIASNATVTTYTALGTEDAEIGHAYIVGVDGAFSTTLTQHASTPSATEFVYDFSTKALTTSGLADGTKLAVFYRVTAAASTKTIQSLATTYAKTVKAVGFGFATDSCSGERYGAQIILPRVKVSDTIELAISADGEPATQPITLEALKDCTSDKLMEVIIFETDLVI
jgi:hypothetical protein